MKLLRSFSTVSIFIVAYLITYKISYLAIHKYIFPFRYADDLDSVVHSSLLAFFISILSGFFLAYLVYRKLTHQNRI